MWWLLLPLACCGVLGYGGPPLTYDELTPAERAAVREAVGLPPLPGREVLHYPQANLGPPARDRFNPPSHWKLVERITPVRTVSVDDLEKLSRREQPPLEYAFPVEFREYDGPYAGRQEEAVAVPVSVPVTADIAKEPTKGLASWLPQRVQSWLPSLPSLSSLIPHLPAYLPGFEFEAEVHRKPIRVPHIPSPAELVKDVNTVMDRALQQLHRKQEQLIELIKCTCPRPARCEGLFNEFLGRPSGGAAAPAEAGEPSVSLFTEVTKPDGGHGASFGFFVDKEGPHLGHHIHNPNAASPASATAQSAAMAAAAPSSTPSSSLAAAQSSAQAASSGDGPASASAQSSAQAASSGNGPASASALSAASASAGGP